MLKKLAAIAVLLVSPMTLIAQENQVKIVALVLTMTEYSPSSDNILASLETLNAQTLRAENPNASELRSVLKRFAAAALDNDIALVFADGQVLKLGDRDFLAPSGLELRRGSDLLTQAIPISALARATALAGNGGAIFIHSSDLGKILPDGVTLSQAAPENRPGTSPILLAQDGSGMALASLFDDHAQRDAMELGAFLTDLTSQVEFSVSYIPSRPVFVRSQATAMPVVTQPVVSDQSESATDAAGSEDAANDAMQTEQAEQENNGLNLPQIETPESMESTGAEPDDSADIVESKPLSIEMLAALQSGLSRAEKRKIQTGLRGLGFYSGLIDGIFGNQTRFSIEAYQESIGADVTGVLSVPQLENFIN